MQVHGLSSAANRAVTAIDNISREVDEVARTVAAGVSSDPDDNAADMLREIERLPSLRQQASANARVVEVADELLSELGSLLRK